MNNTYADNEYDLKKAWEKPEYFTMPQLYSTDKERRTIDAWTRAYFSTPQPVKNTMIDELKMTYTYTLPYALDYIHLEASFPNKTYRVQGLNPKDNKTWWCVPINGGYGSSEFYQTNDINAAHQERHNRERLCNITFGYSFQVVEYHGEE